MFPTEQIVLGIVTKDAPQSTIQAARSSGLPQERVIVISNGSCEAAETEMAEELPDATFVRVHPERGLTHCWNQAVVVPAAAAWVEQPLWTVIANDDVVFDTD